MCKISTNHKSCKQYPRKVYNKFLLVSHIGFLFILTKILLKGSCLENRGLMYMLLCEDYIKFDDCLNESEIQWSQKKSLHLYAFWHFSVCS